MASFRSTAWNSSIVRLMTAGFAFGLFGTLPYTSLPIFAQETFPAPADKPADAKDRQIAVETASKQNTKDEEKQIGKYWIGVSLKPVGGELSSYLEISGGLMVLDVYDNSPASRAKLESGDIITECDGVEVTDFLPFLTAIHEAVGNSLSLTIVRDGNQLPIEITPELRPEQAPSLSTHEYQTETESSDVAVESSDALSTAKIYDASQRAATAVMENQNRDLVGQKLRWMSVGPVVVLDERTESETPLPDDYEITVTQKPGKPAAIECRIAGNKYKGSSENLATLPEQIRDSISRLLMIRTESKQTTSDQQLALAEAARELETLKSSNRFSSERTIVVGKVGLVPDQDFTERLKAAGVAPDAIARIKDLLLRERHEIASPVPSKGDAAEQSVQSELAAMRVEMAEMRADLLRLTEKLLETRK